MAAFARNVRQPHRGWDTMPDHVARAMVYSALRTMSRSHGGPFSRREVQEIVCDVMELPPEECDIGKWDKRRCRTLIVRLLVRGLIYDPYLPTSSGHTSTTPLEGSGS